MPEVPSDAATRTPSDGSVPLRRSLVLRLFGLVAVVALFSVVATAWLTAHTTAAGLRETQGDTLRANTRIARTVLTYAATHPDWAGADRLVGRLATQTGERITVTDRSGTVLVDSSSSGAPVPTGQSTAIDPLDVLPTQPVTDPSAAACSDAADACTTAASFAGPPPGDSPIDEQAVGPLRLTSAERDLSRGLAERAASCLRAQLGTEVSVDVTASGRARVASQSMADVPSACDLGALAQALPSEVEPLAQLQAEVDDCLTRRDGPSVQLAPTLGWVQRTPRTTAGDREVEACLTSARRAQLAPYVAPEARLFVSRPGQRATTFLDLSDANRLRIAAVAALVLLISLGFAALAGRQLVRPLGVLAVTARQLRSGDLSARAAVGGRDEIARVAEAFNAMAERRELDEELRRTMVDDVAHELRNPITTIRGTLEAAQDGLVEVDAALVASVLEETLLLQHVVEDLRDLAAADAGDLRLVVEQVDVEALVHQVLTAHGREAQTLDVALGSDVAAGLTVAADPLRLRQVVGNLVSNAVRHTVGGEVRVVASQDGADVVIAVRDTGEGIAPADLPHVFERFWRADKSRARTSGGGGLGLAITQQLVHAHGGSVSATSTVGSGSSFVVRLPGEEG